MIREIVLPLWIACVAMSPAVASAQWAQGHAPEPKPSETLSSPPDKPSSNCHTPARVQIPAGKYEVSISDAVTRLYTMCYVLGARQGQHLDISMTDASPNTAISVLLPGWHFRELAQGGDLPEGPGLPGLGTTSEQQSAHARLPESGDYLVVMGLTRGGAGRYTMRVRIR